MNTYEMSLNLRNRKRCAKRVALNAIKKNVLFALVLPLLYAIAFAVEPVVWRDHCQKMQMMLDKQKKVK